MNDVSRPLAPVQSALGGSTPASMTDWAGWLCHVRRLDNLASALHMLVEAVF